jgi:hypothetical protein
MRSLLINLDDELSHLLSKEKNQNEIVRKALRLYYSDIDTSDRQHMKAAWTAIKKYLSEIDSKIDYIERKIR